MLSAAIFITFLLPECVIIVLLCLLLLFAGLLLLK